MDRGGLHHYLLKRHYQAEEKRTVGKRAGKPVSEMEDLTSRVHLQDEGFDSPLARAHRKLSLNLIPPLLFCC